MAKKSSSTIYLNPRNVTVLRQHPVTGDWLEFEIDESLADITFEHTRPVRAVDSWKGKNVYEGDYWSSTNRGFIHFESFLERECLMKSDFDQHVVGIQWQPFVLVWPQGRPRHRAHVPDFFVRLRNGNGRVIDVKRPDKVDASQEQFDMTAQVCKDVGWEYEVFTGLPEPELSTVAFLAGFRHSRFRSSPEVTGQILDAFVPATSFVAGVRRAARQTGLSSTTVRSHVLHLLWHRLLEIPLELPLDDSAIVSSTSEARSS